MDWSRKLKVIAQIFIFRDQPLDKSSALRECSLQFGHITSSDRTSLAFIFTSAIMLPAQRAMRKPTVTLDKDESLN
ncbi:hypothetical protein VI817_010499 [Penicillium citrinum]|nr:hypothetical protein VI817_010499 [Penicillium citrinum]